MNNVYAVDHELNGVSLVAYAL